MSIVTNLKLITNTKNHAVSPILQRRSKLVAKLQEQLDLCQAQRSGETYAPNRTNMRTTKDKEHTFCQLNSKLM